jgi:hypothetical protein
MNGIFGLHVATSAAIQHVPESRITRPAIVVKQSVQLVNLHCISTIVEMQ